MTCREIFAKLSEYIEFELPPEACREMEQHLARCPPCIEFTQSLRRTVELCRQYRPAEFPAPLAREARDRLEAAYRDMLAARTNRGSDSPE
jgi:RNA polymerase sigma-70 factor, ECF subfamily